MKKIWRNDMTKGKKIALAWTIVVLFISAFGCGFFMLNDTFECIELYKHIKEQYDNECFELGKIKVTGRMIEIHVWDNNYEGTDKNVYLQLKNTVETASDFVKESPVWKDKISDVILTVYDSPSLPTLADISVDVKTGKIRYFDLSSPEFKSFSPNQITDINNVESLRILGMPNNLPYTEDLKKLDVLGIKPDAVSQIPNAVNLEELSLACPSYTDLSELTKCNKLNDLDIYYFSDNGSSDFNYESLKDVKALNKLTVIIPHCDAFKDVDRVAIQRELHKLLPGCKVVVEEPQSYK